MNICSTRFLWYTIMWHYFHSNLLFNNFFWWHYLNSFWRLIKEILPSSENHLEICCHYTKCIIRQKHHSLTPDSLAILAHLFPKSNRTLDHISLTRMLFNSSVMNHICTADSIKVLKKALGMTEWWVFVNAAEAQNLVHCKTILFKIFCSIAWVCFLCHPCSALSHKYLMSSIQRSFSVTAHARVVLLR